MHPPHSNMMGGSAVADYFSHKPPSAPVWTRGASYVSLDSLSNTGIVKGNFKDPNNWSYTAQRSNRWNGTAVWDDFSLAGAPLRRSVLGLFIGSDIEHTGSGSYTWHAVTNRDFDALWNVALGELGEKVRGSIDLSIDAAQARSTYKSIALTERLGNVYRFYRNLRHSPGTVMKEVGSKWLEWQYGVKPTLQTIYDVAHLADKTAREQFTKFEGKAAKRLKFRPPRAVNVDTGFGLIQSITPSVVDGKGLDFVKITVQMDTSQFPDVGYFTSLNPVSIAWELMPYSFVVDWFFNVGDYLRNVENALLYQRAFKNGFYSRGEFMDVKWHAQTYNATNGSTLRNVTISADSSASYKWFERVKLTSYPLPRFPSVKAELGSGRLLNAAALLSQFLGRSGHR